MKKRIFSIMDTSKKRVGFAVVCAMLLLTIGTCVLFAINANGNEEKNIIPKLANESTPISTPAPEEALYIDLASLGTEVSYDPDTNGNPEKGNFSFINIPPGDTAYSNMTYQIESSKTVLSFTINWVATGLPIEVGFVSEEDSSVFYTIPLTSGSASEDMKTKGIPSGRYYVVVVNPGVYDDKIFGTIGYHFEQ